MAYREWLLELSNAVRIAEGQHGPPPDDLPDADDGALSDEDLAVLVDNFTRYRDTMDTFIVILRGYAKDRGLDLPDGP
jgi:hypothetical protein